jgi:hypothetical protein
VIGAGALALGLSACVRGEYRRTIVDAPIESERVAALVPGRSGLAECLAVLGAPHFVWEYRGDGLALGYGWFRGSHWGASASYQVARGVSASMDYADLDGATRGYVLFLDGRWVLEGVRKGRLRDLTEGARKPRPAGTE